MNSIKIFGYGSLINLDSLKKDVPKFSNVQAATLHGYKRFFGKKAGHSFTADGRPISVLDIKESKDHFVNGICFDVPIEFIENLQKREKAYRFVEVAVKLDNSE